MRLAYLACVAAIMAPGVSAGAQPNAIDSIRTPQTSSLMDFWTDDRRQDAKAMPVPVNVGLCLDANPVC